MRRLGIKVIFLIVCLGLSVVPAAAVVTIAFDEFPAGTRIDEQYNSQGIHFFNDYQEGSYHASPLIVSYHNIHGPSNVLENDYYDWELSSSGNASMVFWFDNPVSGIGMWLGTIESPQSSFCSYPVEAKVSVYTCGGSLISTKSVTVSTALNTPLEIDDPQGRIQMVVVDYGETGCPEVIEDLAFEPGSGQCTDSVAPSVSITAPADGTLLNTPDTIIQGKAVNSGILKTVRIDGTKTPFYLTSNQVYLFEGPVILHEGANTVTALAEGISGKKGSDQVILYLGTPSTVSLNQLHITQRGVLKNMTCDLDGTDGASFVAGKSTLIRIDLDVRTASGLKSYVTMVEMILKRHNPASGQWEVVNNYMGTMYSPYVSMFNSPNDMAAIHFWIPGYDVEEGSYTIEFQPYVGGDPFPATPLIPMCVPVPTIPVDVYSFKNTDSVKVFILPVELGMLDPLQTPDHIYNSFGQLAALAGTFPVRDGFSAVWEKDTTGVYYVESGPFRLCDGSLSMKDTFSYCEGTGFNWTIIDKDPSGVLHIADHQVVYAQNRNDPTIPCGDMGLKTVGGQALSDIYTDDAHSMRYNPALGIFRGGAHPTWCENGFCAKYYYPIDENHNGTMDLTDMQHIAAEFFDNETKSWSTDFNKYSQGETFRIFRDINGTNCNEEGGEPQAAVVTLWHNAGKLLYDQGVITMNAYNSQGSKAIKPTFASMWFPEVINPERYDFGVWGPGSSRGNGNWIRVLYRSSMAHEMGHNIVDLEDQYTDTVRDDMVTQENAWGVYIDGQAVPPSQVFTTMGADVPANRSIHLKSDYDKLYRKLDPPSIEGPTTLFASTQTYALALPVQQFMIAGNILKDGSVENVVSGMVSGLENTPPDPQSPYSIVFGAGTSVLSTHPFTVDETVYPPQGYSTWPLGFTPFSVVAPLPDEPQWVEVRYQDQVKARIERSSSPPAVQLVFPDGGQSFGSNAEVPVRWEASDPDGDPLISTLYYSPDGGDQRWIVLATNLRGTEFIWTLRDSPGTIGNAGIIKVVTSDGFNSGEDQSDTPFSVENKPPLITILQPVENNEFLQCAHIWLHGEASDPEGQIESTSWTIDGFFVGSHERLMVDPLPPGTHDIMFTAVDTFGVSSTDRIHIKVYPDSDCDGMNDAFEGRYGLNPGFVEDSALDNDHDGLINFDEAWWKTNPNNPDTDGDGINDGEEVVQGTNPIDSFTAIALSKTATPTMIHAGDMVTYTMQVLNEGDVVLSDITVADGTMTPTYQSGDTNSDSKLDIIEVWTYTATASPTSTVTNTAYVTGTDPTGTTVSGSSQATVTVIHPAIHLEKIAIPAAIYRGNSVTYTYTVTNTGDIPLKNILVTDDKVIPAYQSGDANGDGLLDLAESWIYSATSSPTNTVTNTATASGTDPLGLTVRSTNTATVVVTVIVNVDVKPGSCPNGFGLNAKGVVPVAISGGVPHYTLDEIDTRSIRLNGVPVVNIHTWDAATPYLQNDLCRCHAINGDGAPDIVFQVDAPSLIGTLGSPAKKSFIPLTVTGTLTDGITFMKGSDCVKIS